LRAAWLIWKIDKFDFLACLGAFVGVFFVSVEIGLLIAVSWPSSLLRGFRMLFKDPQNLKSYRAMQVGFVIRLE